MKIDLYDGKYTYIINDDGSNQRALRYGEPWRNLVGDGFVLAMAQKIEELKLELKEYQSASQRISELERDYERVNNALIAVVKNLAAKGNEFHFNDLDFEPSKGGYL